MQYLEGFGRLRLISDPGVPLFQKRLARVSPIAGRQEFEPHCMACNVARPVLSAIDRRGTDPSSAPVKVSHEQAELSDSIAHEVDFHRADEGAVDLSQNQRLSAKKALDLGGIGPSS